MNSAVRHPFTLFPLTLCYSLFMAAFGGILASLTLYQTNQLHMPDSTAFGVFSAAMALLWILPLGGGYLGAKWGYFMSCCVGLWACIAGMLCLGIENIHAMYLGLACFVVGNAFVTPNIMCLVDHCYAKESPLREAGFTLFYLFFNLGAVLSIFAGGEIALRLSFKTEFWIDALLLMIAFGILIAYRHRMTVHPERSIQPQVKWTARTRFMAFVGLTLAGVPVSVLLFQNITLNNCLMIALLVLMVFVLLHMARNAPTRQAGQRLYLFTILSLISIAFWTLYSLEPSFLSVFIQTNVDTTFLGLDIPASSYFAFDGVFVILIGLVLSRIWYRLSLRNKNPSLAFKFASALILIGLGFAVLAGFIAHHLNEVTPAREVVFVYAIFSLAELLVSPLGISMVGSLAPEGKEGLMIGVWQLASGIGGVFAGFISMATPLPSSAVSMAISNKIYLNTFLWTGIGAMVLGVLVMIFVPKLKRLMQEHAYKVPQI